MTIDRGRFENLESDHQYESNLESDVRFEIESNNEASQVPRLYASQYVSLSHTVLNWMQQNQNLIADIWVLLPCPHPRVGRHWLTVFVLLTGDRQVFNLAPFTDKHFRIRGLGDTIKDLHNLLFLYPDIPKARTFSKFWTQGWPVFFVFWSSCFIAYVWSVKECCRRRSTTTILWPVFWNNLVSQCQNITSCYSPGMFVKTVQPTLLLLTFWSPMFPHGYSYKASCGRLG